jgi:ribosomal protein S18 acetylase RimI-like enzyme
VEEKDLQSICKLPESREILFFMFPRAVFPLDVEQLQTKMRERFDNTVFLDEDTIIGYANLYYYNDEKEPYIGHVIIDKLYRGKGYGKKILQTMIKKASKYHNGVKLAVFSENKNALLLYRSLGFTVFRTDTRKDYEGVGREVLLMELEIEDKGKP